MNARRDVHEVKSWPEYFEAVVDGSRPFDLRFNDRDYRVGDLLILREWRPDTKRDTGRVFVRRVTYVQRGGQLGLDAQYVALGLGAATPPEPLDPHLARAPGIVTNPEAAT